MKKKGFTLIELLVSISIIGIILSLSVFGIQNARKNSRDAQRKSDLESIRSALELYKADEGVYPSSSDLVTALVPEYIKALPTDPINGGNYVYDPMCNEGTGSGVNLSYCFEDASITCPAPATGENCCRYMLRATLEIGGAYDICDP